MHRMLWPMRNYDYIAQLGEPTNSLDRTGIQMSMPKKAELHPLGPKPFPMHRVYIILYVIPSIRGFAKGPILCIWTVGQKLAQHVARGFFPHIHHAIYVYADFHADFPM